MVLCFFLGFTVYENLDQVLKALYILVEKKHLSFAVRLKKLVRSLES